MGDPVVVCGMGCRLPGDIEGWHDLRRALYRGPGEEGEGAFVHPTARWTRPPSSVFAADRLSPDVRLGQVTYESWDPEFFGISPAEATSVKPTTRLLLQAAWHAFEDAGVRPSELAGRPVGVFIATDGEDGFLNLGLENTGRSFFGRWGNNTFSVATISGRLAYSFDLTGPALNIETACSGGMVALHYGAQAILNGEAEGAIVGGATAHCSPFAFQFLDAAGLISPNARCATYDSSADGYIMSEGAVVFYITRRSHAQARQLPILAEIASSAVAHAGKTRGMLRPTRESQEALLRTCLHKAALAPADVDFVEAHGTGTKTGDQVEMEALLSVFGPDAARDRPLIVSSSKTVLGHGHEISGLVGLARAILCLVDGVISPHRNFKKQAAYLEGKADLVEIPTSPRPLGPSRRADGRFIAGISSFGFAGTIAHTIVKGGPVPDGSEDDGVALGISSGGALLTLSARRLGPLTELVRRYLSDVSAGPVDTRHILRMCRTTNLGREHWPHHRLAIRTDGHPAILAADLGEALRRLEAASKAADGAAGGRPLPRICFLFSAETDQLFALGHRLSAAIPTFRNAVEECRVEAQMIFGDEFALPTCRADRTWSTVGGFGEDTGSLLVFIYQYGLSKTMAEMGIRPDFVVGYSMGEFAAACASGFMSLSYAINIICHRERLIKDPLVIPDPGAVLSVQLSADEVREVLSSDDRLGSCEIGGYLTEESTLVTGGLEDVRAAEAALVAQGVFCRDLGLGYGYHSSHVQAVSSGLMVGDFPTPEPRVGDDAVVFVSTVTGAVLPSGTALGVEYWAKHLRSPIRLQQAIEAINEAAATTFEKDQRPLLFVDFGPTSSLSRVVKSISRSSRARRSTTTTKHAHPTFEFVSLCNKWGNACPVEGFLSSVGNLYEHGVDVAFDLFWAPTAPGAPLHREAVSLKRKPPLYPFQRIRYWPDPPRDQKPSLPGPRATDSKESITVPAKETTVSRVGYVPHPFVGDRTTTADGATVFSKRLDESSIALLDNHKVGAWVVMSMTMFVDAVLVAADRAYGEKSSILRSIVPRRPFCPVFDKGQTTTLEIVIRADKTFQVLARTDSQSNTLYVDGQLEVAALPPRSWDRSFFDSYRSGLLDLETSENKLYEGIAGLVFGHEFRLLTKLAKATDNSYLRSHVRVPPSAKGLFCPHSVHPGLLDACIHGIIFAYREENGGHRTMFYESIEGVEVYRNALVADRTTCYAVRTAYEPADRSATGRLKTSYTFLVVDDETQRTVVYVKAAHFTAVHIANDKTGKSADLPPRRSQQQARVKFADDVAPPQIRRAVAPAEPMDVSASSQIYDRPDRTPPLVASSFSLTWHRLRRPPPPSGGALVFVLSDDAELCRTLDVANVRAVHIRPEGPVDAMEDAIATCFSEARASGAGRVTLALLLSDVACTDLSGLEERNQQQIVSALALIRTATKQANRPFVVSCRLVTRGFRMGPTDGDGRVAGGERQIRSLQYACLAGLAKAARTELAHVLDICAIDIPFSWSNSVGEMAAMVRDLGSAPITTPIVVVRGSPSDPVFWQPRYERLPDLLPKTQPLQRFSGTYVITGGLGHLGLHILPWLVSHGAERVVLVGRKSASEPSVRRRLDEAELLSAGRAIYVSADVSTESGVLAVLDEARAIPSMPLRGILLCTIVLADRAVVRQNWNNFKIAVDAKLPPAWLFHAHTVADDLETFVLFSSVTSAFGGFGQANYTAANHFVEQLAIHRVQNGLKAVAVQLGPLDQSEAVKGMAPVIGRLFPPLSASDILRPLSVALGPSPPVVLLTSLQPDLISSIAWTKNEFLWSEFARPSQPEAGNSTSSPVNVKPETTFVSGPSPPTAMTTAAPLGPALSSFNGETVERTTIEAEKDVFKVSLKSGLAKQTTFRSEPEETPLPAAPGDPTIEMHIKAAPATSVADRSVPGLAERISTIVGEMLQLPIADVDGESDLFDLGVDSLMMIQLATKMQAETGVELPSEQITGVSTVHSLAEWFAQALTEADIEEETCRSSASTTTTLVDMSAAIVTSVG